MRIISTLFPLLGIAAFILLWLHIALAPLEPWLRKYINFEKFVDRTSSTILVLILLHPLLLLISFSFNIHSLLLSYSLRYLVLALMGWLMLITYDIGRFFKKRNNDFFFRHWDQVLAISSVGFIFIFFHSLGLGSDLQSGPLRTLWLFLGSTAILSVVYNYGIKKLTR